MTHAIRLAVLGGLAAIVATLAPAALATGFSGFTVIGYIATSEPHSCDGGIGGDLTTNSTVTWTRCHELKRHVDESGAPITADAFVETASRPLQVTVDLDVVCTYGPKMSDGVPIASVRTQTDATGRFKAWIPDSTCGVPTWTADGIAISATLLLQYEERDSTGAVAGTVRALWDRSRGDVVYPSILPPQPTVYSDSSGDFVIPRMILDTAILPLPLPSYYHDFGRITFFAGTAPYYYDYVRAALGTWSTLLALHDRLKEALAVDGHDALYRRMFVSYPEYACTSCYTVGFQNPASGGAGGAGGFIIDRPRAASAFTPDEYAEMVSVGLPAHEFGHSMHGAIAPNSFGNPDFGMNYGMDPTGGLGYSRGAYSASGSTMQMEMVFAWGEGFGDAMGSYFLNGCNYGERPWGDPDPLVNMWNPSSLSWCTANADCPIGFFRYQMVERGIAEGSATWAARRASLEDLANRASTVGAVMVDSNNETKVRSFVCDLLDDNPDVSFAAGRIAGATYMPDFTWHVGERLDGRAPPLTFATYASDPPPETVTITLGTLLDAMDRFVVGLGAWPSPLPVLLTPTGAIVDGANASYNEERLSTRASMSPQALARYLVGAGAVTRDQINGILRANRMEELP